MTGYRLTGTVVGTKEKEMPYPWDIAQIPIVEWLYVDDQAML